MKTQILNGKWNYRVGKGEFEEITVPFSKLCVGHSECTKSFDLRYDYNTVLLKFDGITYNANVYLNDTYLGKMLSYSEYVFDITKIAKAENNQLLVELEDINAPFGPSEGWENYGGIIRNVSLIYEKENYILNTIFVSNPTNNYKNANYSVEVNTKNDKGTISVELSYNGEIVDTYQGKIGEIVERNIKNVHLWSPNTPKLYTLKITLYDNDEILDIYEEKVGIREFKCDKEIFYLNGEPIFLKGVCKHEMYGSSGHTVEEHLIKKDLELIKEMGCNFVRLVHYPHNKKVIEYCDEIGLMCCEEPGLWQSDTSNPEVVKDCLEVLEKTVIRDRNHPSIVFWLCFNECDFNEEFLKRSVEVCRNNDKTRLVSGANNMSDEDTLKYYNLCDLDFYTMHPYYETFEKARKSAEILRGKPLVFTEWGGYYVYDNPHLLKDFLLEMHSLYNERKLAGECLWYFAEIYDCNRGGAACVDGVLKEALVDINRTPNLIYHAFCQALKQMDENPKEIDKYEYTQIEKFTPKSIFKCNGKTDISKLINVCNNPPYTRLAKTRKKKVTVGPVIQKDEIIGISKTPYLLDNPLTFTPTEPTNKISIIGMTSVLYGYPLFGEYGEIAAEIKIYCKDKTVVTYSLKNGVDFCLAHSSIGSSRINPLCENATRIATFSYDKNFEEYVVNKLDITVGKEIENVVITPNNEKYKLLIYGVYGN